MLTEAIQNASIETALALVVIILPLLLFGAQIRKIFKRFEWEQSKNNQTSKGEKHVKQNNGVYVCLRPESERTE